MGIRARLRRFFYSDDETVKLADGLSEFDAAQYDELLRNSGIVAMRKNMSGLAAYGVAYPTLSSGYYALFVKQSDLDAASRVLGHLLERYETEEAREVRRVRGRRRK